MSDDASAPAPEPAPAEDAKDAKQPVAAQAVDDDEQVPYAERLAQEEERCDAAKVQLEVVKARTEEVHEQLRFYTGGLQLTGGCEISRQDEIDLAAAFSKDIFDVLHDVLAEAEKPDDFGFELPEEEEEASSNDDEDDGKPPKQLSVFGTDGKTQQDRQIKITYDPPDDREEISAVFRIHDEFAYYDLRWNMFVYLGGEEAIGDFEDFELYSPEHKHSVLDDDQICSEGATHQYHELGLFFRRVPEVIREAERDDALKKAEEELQGEMFSKAQMARRQGDALRNIAFERKRSRHAKSLIIRGFCHGLFTLALGVMIVLDMGGSFNSTGNRGYWTSKAIKDAIEKPFASNIVPRPLNCTRMSAAPGGSRSYPRGSRAAAREDADEVMWSFLFGRNGPRVYKNPAQYTMTFNDIKTPHDVRMWLIGPLVDALAPQCSYSGHQIVYEDGQQGSIAETNIMLTSMRLQQTRFKDTSVCSHETIRNYPNLDDSQESHNQQHNHYPACQTFTERNTAPFYIRDTSLTHNVSGTNPPGGFAYTPAPERWSGRWYEACARTCPTCNRKCYGPGGYVVDLWEAKTMRARIIDLVNPVSNYDRNAWPPEPLPNSWIDDSTESVIVLLQLANMQTQCLTFVEITFEFRAGGSVKPYVHIEPVCTTTFADDMKNQDAKQLINFGYWPPFQLAVLILSLIYASRNIYSTFVHITGYQIGIRPCTIPLTKIEIRFLGCLKTRDRNEFEKKESFKAAGWWLDAIVALSVFTWASFLLVDRFAFQNLLTVFYEEKTGPNADKAVQAAVQHFMFATAEFYDKRDRGVMPKDIADAAIHNLKNAMFLGGYFSGAPYLQYGYESGDVNMRVPQQFVPLFDLYDFRSWAKFFQSTTFMACVFKLLRYFQAWQPLAWRYVSLVKVGPQVALFFLFLAHLQFCFSMQAWLLFHHNSYSDAGVEYFATVYESWISLTSVLVGNIKPIKALSSSSLIGFIFSFIYIVFMCVTVSALIISVLADGWENATLLLRKRDAQKRQLKMLDWVQKDAEEYVKLKKLMDSVGDKELEELAEQNHSWADLQDAKKRGKSSRFSLMKKKSTQFDFSNSSLLDASPTKAARLAKKGMGSFSDGSEEALSKAASSSRRVSFLLLSPAQLMVSKRARLKAATKRGKRVHGKGKYAERSPSPEKDAAEEIEQVNSAFLAAKEEQRKQMERSGGLLTRVGRRVYRHAKGVAGMVLAVDAEDAPERPAIRSNKIKKEPSFGFPRASFYPMAAGLSPPRKTWSPSMDDLGSDASGSRKTTPATTPTSKPAANSLEFDV